MRKILLGFALIALFAAGTASAQCTNVLPGTQTLATLIANPMDCLTIGDKQFFDFSYAPSPTGPPSPAAGAINVSAIVDPFTGDLGVQFQGNFNLDGGTTGATYDFLLGYKVTATAGLISSISNAAIAGCIRDSGTGACSSSADVNIVENAVNGGQTATSTLDLKAGHLFDPPALAGENLNFVTPVSSATIGKDVTVTAGAGDNVLFSAIIQDFAQVPEPRAYALVLGLGFALLLWRKRVAAKA